MKKIFKKCYDVIKKGVGYIMAKVNEIIDIRKEVEIKKLEIVEKCIDTIIELPKQIGKVIYEHPVVFMGCGVGVALSVVAIGGAIIIEKKDC